MSESDEFEAQPTPPATVQARPGHRPRSQWSDDDRALEGQRHRQNAGKNGQRAGAAPTPPQTALPVEETDPFQLMEVLDKPAPPRVAKIIERSRRNSGDLVTVDLLMTTVHQMMEKSSESRETQMGELRKLLAAPPHQATIDLQKAVADLQRKTGPLLRVWDWALAGIGAAALAIGIFLYSRGGVEREVQMRLDALERSDRVLSEMLEKALGEIHRDIRALERRGNNKDPGP